MDDVKTLQQLFKSKCTCISIITHEEEYALEVVRTASMDYTQHLCLWSASEGVHGAMFAHEDEEDNVLDADPEHPIVIFPEPFHHVSITDKVRFRVEFYEVPSGIASDAPQKEGERPGEDFI